MAHTRRAAAVALLVAALVVPTALPVAAVPDARLTVTDATVTPGTPVAGAPVTVTATVQNAAGSPEAVTVEAVALQSATGVNLTVARGIGSLSPGGTLTVPLTHTFERAAQYDLSLVAYGTDETGDAVVVERPLTVVVEAARPQIELRPRTAVVGIESTTDVVVSNPTTDQLRDLTVEFRFGDGDAAPVVERRTVPALAAGASTTVNFTAVPADADTHRLVATVAYTTAAGTRDTVSQTQYLTVERLVADVGVRAEPVVAADQGASGNALGGQLGGQLGVLLGGGDGGGATQPDTAESDAPQEVAVTVTNFGNVPAESVVVTPRVGDLTLPRQSVTGPLAPGEAATVTVALVDAPAGEVTFDVTYRAGDRTGSAQARYDYRPEAGAVSVTGVSLELGEGGRLSLSGNLGNVGDGPISGVVVRVGENEYVQPSYPSRDYFVGTVDASEFAPFDLTARVDPENAAVVPVEVSYRTNGVERTQTFELPYDETLEPPAENGSFPFDIALVVGAVLAVVVVGAAVVLRRR